MCINFSALLLWLQWHSNTIIWLLQCIFSHHHLYTYNCNKTTNHSISIHCCIVTSCTYYITLWLKTHYSIHNKIMSIQTNISQHQQCTGPEEPSSGRRINFSQSYEPVTSNPKWGSLLHTTYKFLMLMYFLSNWSVNPLLFVHYMYALDLFLSNKIHEDFSPLGCDAA
jgi:hypothetical protein